MTDGRTGKWGGAKTKELEQRLVGISRAAEAPWIAPSLLELQMRLQGVACRLWGPRWVASGARTAIASFPDPSLPTGRYCPSSGLSFFEVASSGHHAHGSP